MASQMFLTTHGEALQDASRTIQVLLAKRPEYAPHPFRLQHIIPPLRRASRRRLWRRSPPALVGQQAHHVSYNIFYFICDMQRYFEMKFDLRDQELIPLTTRYKALSKHIDNRMVTLYEFLLTLPGPHTAIRHYCVVEEAEGTSFWAIDSLDEEIIDASFRPPKDMSLEKEYHELLSAHIMDVALICAGYYGPDALHEKILELKDDYASSSRFDEVCGLLEKIRAKGSEQYEYSQTNPEDTVEDPQSESPSRLLALLEGF